MPRIDNERFYAASIARHGFNAQGVHWNSQGSQRLRFKIIASLLPRSLEPFSLVDAGCGFADFYDYLGKIERLPARYVGLDCMEPMVAEARRRTEGDIRLCDILHDPLIEADYYVCSGAMNILTPFETHLFIRRCFEHSRRGFVFNILSGKDESMVYNYVTARQIAAIGRDLGADVQIESDYLERDITVLFSRKAD